MAMAETRRKFDRDFKEGAVWLVRETGKPVAQVPTMWGTSTTTVPAVRVAALAASVARA
jgi:transposase